MKDLKFIRNFWFDCALKWWFKYVLVVQMAHIAVT